MRDNLGLSLHQEIGRRFEELVKDILTHSFGFDVLHISNWNASFDLQINGRNVEVKSAYPTMRVTKGKPRTRWQFNFTSKADETSAYYVVLVAIDDNENEFMYCIPGSEITGPTIQLTSHPSKYTGKYAKYLFDFDGLINFIEGN